MGRTPYEVRWRRARDALLLAGGILGVIHETVVADEPSEALLVVFTAMMGLTAVMRADERHHEPDDDDEGPGGLTVEELRKMTLTEFEDFLKRMTLAVRFYPRSTTWVALWSMTALMLASVS